MTNFADAGENVKSPPGVTAIYIYEGRVIASASDFDRNAPGGCTLREGQTWRAARRLSIEVVKALASPTLYEGLDGHDCEQIVRKMKGRQLIVAIGHADE